jgi:hypothetical protein
MWSFQLFYFSFLKPLVLSLQRWEVFLQTPKITPQFGIQLQKLRQKYPTIILAVSIFL